MTATVNPEAFKYAREKNLRKARHQFKDFVRHTMPDYKWGWFNEALCMRLQRFYHDYEAGKNPRLMIFAPPRSGKSELASRRFPAWLAGIDNRNKIMASSFSSALANRMSRDCKRIVDHRDFNAIFQDTRLPSKQFKGADNAVNSVEYWEFLNDNGLLTSGSYRCAGVGGGISGMGFNIGIIDDPVKDYKEASSKTIQQSILEWYDTTFYTRRDPLKNGIILIMTRWHKKDLAGELTERMKDGTGDDFDVFSFPMEAVSNEYFSIEGKTYKTRNKGDILFPERMPQDFVNQCKTNPLTWTALYQQNPTIAGGNFFKSHHWAYHTPESLANIKWKRKIITVDTAQKKGEQNDYTVFQVWGYDGTRIYLLHQVRAKLHSYELRAAGERIWQEYGGGIVGSKVNADSFFIEDKVSGTGLIQELRKQGIPCIEVPRQDDKVTRAIDCHSYFHSGLVVLPTHAPWLSEYLMEFEDFNLDDTHEHDDQVDATLDGVNILLKGEGGINYGGY